MADFVKNRDFLTKEVNEMSLPWKATTVEGGYFLMVDISECCSLIPEKYLTTTEFEDPEDPKPVKKFQILKPDGTVPMDVAFCRWMAHKNGVAFMPNSFFFASGSPNLNDQYVRLAICKDFDSTSAAAARLRSIQIGQP